MSNITVSWELVSADPGKAVILFNGKHYYLTVGDEFRISLPTEFNIRPQTTASSGRKLTYEKRIDKEEG